MADWRPGPGTRLFLSLYAPEDGEDGEDGEDEEG